MAFSEPQRRWYRGVERGIQLGNVRRGKVLGRGGVALEKRGLVAVELACSSSLFWTGGVGGQRLRQVGVIGHLTVEEW